MIKPAGSWAYSRWVAALLSLSVAAHAVAAVAGEDAGIRPQAATTQTHDESGGLVPRRLVWPGVAVIVVLAVIVTAALTGPIIKANTDDQDGGDSSPPISSE